MQFIKQQLTPERAANIKESMMVMCLLANVMKMEYAADMDVNFKNPMVNQFAGRIIKDVEAILYHLRNYSTNAQVSDQGQLEEYAGEMYRVIHYFIRLPLGQMKEIMDNIESLTEVVEVTG